jgi:hypothetical protein
MTVIRWVFLLPNSALGAMAAFTVFNLLWFHEFGDFSEQEPGFLASVAWLCCASMSCSWGFVFLGSLSAPSHQLMVAILLALLALCLICIGGLASIVGVGTIGAVIMTVGSMIGSLAGAGTTFAVAWVLSTQQSRHEY